MAETADKIAGGLSVEDFLERESGGPFHLAVGLAELGSAAEMGRREWEYDESPEAVELVRLCAALDDYLKDLSIVRTTGALTRYRECSRCSGAGRIAGGEKLCMDCAGRGSVHADEADQ